MHCEDPPWQTEALMDADADAPEPNCLPCGDTRHAGPRRCPDCNPGLLSRCWWLLAWRLRNRLHIARLRRRGELDDSPV